MTTAYDVYEAALDSSNDILEQLDRNGLVLHVKEYAENVFNVDMSLELAEDIVLRAETAHCKTWGNNNDELRGEMEFPAGYAPEIIGLSDGGDGQISFNHDYYIKLPLQEIHLQ